MNTWISIVNWNCSGLQECGFFHAWVDCSLVCLGVYVDPYYLLHHWSRMGGFYINGCATRKTLRWFLRIIIPDSAAFGDMGLACTEGSFTSNRNNHIQECWLFHTSMSKSGLPALDWFLLKELHYTTTHPPCTWKFVTHDYLPRPKKSRDSSTTNLSHISMLTQLLFTSPFACTIGYLLRCAVLRIAPPFLKTWLT